MRILYGAVGEGLGHATRSRVVVEHLLAQGHEVRMAASGRALEYLRAELDEVEEIWGLGFALNEGEVDLWRTVGLNVRGGVQGIPVNVRVGLKLARSFGAEVVLTDFDGFAYTVAKLERIPVVSIDNIQMVDRCRHEPALLRRTRTDYLAARAFVGAKLPRANRYLITTFFYPPLRKERTELVPPVLRPEIVAARPEPGEHLLVYGRLGATALSALQSSHIPCRVYGARDGLAGEKTEGNLVYLPFSSERFVDDLRTCRGVVASAGFSLMSEVVYLRKPMLAVPLAGQFEQEMNAFYLERLGFGTAAAGLDAGALERFLKHVDDHAEALGGYEQDGNTAALEAVDRTIEELVAALARPRRRRERPSVGDDAPGGTGR